MAVNNTRLDGYPQPTGEAWCGERDRAGYGQLQQPSLKDWNTWRCTIVCQYLDEGFTAAAIVQQLRQDGYQVTVKMLRDRLRLWEANKKAQSSVAAPLRLERPSCALDLPLTEGRHVNILSRLDTLLELAWQQNAGVERRSGSDIVGLVSDFNSMAIVAVETGRAQAWAAVNRAAADIASVNWSTLSADQITAMVLTQPSWSYSYPDHPANVEQRHLQSILLSVMMMQLGRSHPLVLFMEEKVQGRLSAELCYSAGRLDEARIRQHAPSGRQHRILAESKRRLASILCFFREYKAIDGVLGAYDPTDAHDGVPIWAQGYIQTMLGRSKYAQGRYADAVAHFRYAENMDDGADLISTVYVAHYGAASFLALNDSEGAEKWLRGLLRTLQTSMGAEGSVDSECLAFDIRCLCRTMRGWVELQDVLDQLASMGLGQDESGHRAQTTKEI